MAVNALAARCEDFAAANGWPTAAQIRTAFTDRASYTTLTLANTNTMATQLVGAGEAFIGANGRIRINPAARTR